jgi:hypothetical protein
MNDGISTVRLKPTAFLNKLITEQDKSGIAASMLKILNIIKLSFHSHLPQENSPHLIMNLFQ